MNRGYPQKQNACLNMLDMRKLIATALKAAREKQVF